MRVVFYAINGTGLGHLTRLVAIARNLRQLLQAVDLRPRIAMVTTSEASHIAAPLPVYKVPSRAVLREAGFDARDYSAGAKLMVSNLVAGLSPDLLVLDTVPEGAFGEFAFLRSYARATAFVDRHRDPSVALSEVQRRHVTLYDRVLVPDDAAQAARYPGSQGAHERRVFVGPIHNVQGSELLSREAIADRFGVPPGHRIVYATGGGGAEGREVLARIVEIARGMDRVFVLVGHGPLHRGAMLRGPNVAPIVEPDAWRYFAGVDVAISAAGYNSYQELLAAQTPTVFYAQPKNMDRQDERIRLGLERGLHLALANGAPVAADDIDAAAVRAAIADALGDARPRLQEALAARPAPVGALVAAAELAVLGARACGAKAEASEIKMASAMLAEGERRGAAAGDALAAVRSHRAWLSLSTSRAHAAAAHDAGAVSYAALSSSPTASPDASLTDSYAWGETLVRYREAAGWDPPRWTRWLRLLLEGADEREIALRERVEMTLAPLHEHLGDRFGEGLAWAADSMRKLDLPAAMEHWAAVLDAEPEGGQAVAQLERMERHVQRGAKAPLTLRELKELLVKTASAEASASDAPGQATRRGTDEGVDRGRNDALER